MTTKQISVFLENRSGQLTEITKILADAKINLRALNIAETTEYGIARIICDDIGAAVDALIGSGMVISVNPINIIEIPDVIGGLNSVLEKIAAAGIDIEYMYSIIDDKEKGAQVAIKVSKPEELAKVL